MKRKLFYCISAGLLSLATLGATAQSGTPSKLEVSIWKGMVVAGYYDKGAFVNFGGPALSWQQGQTKLMLGMLPSLRFLEDATGDTKNSLVTPTLGAGLAVSYRHFVLQVPLYYAAKTATADGKWRPGVGLGYQF